MMTYFVLSSSGMTRKTALLKSVRPLEPCPSCASEISSILGVYPANTAERCCWRPCAGRSSAISVQKAKPNLIDKYQISIVPIILGDGIRLFDLQMSEIKLTLKSCTSNNGTAELIYEPRL